MCWVLRSEWYLQHGLSRAKAQHRQEYRREGGEEVGLLRLRAEGGSGPAGWWSWCLLWEVYFSGCVVLCGD